MAKKSNLRGISGKVMRWRRRQSKKRASNLRPLLLVTGLAGIAGAALAYFLDPQTGRRRRKMAVERSSAFSRHSLASGGKLWRAASAQVYGSYQKLIHLKPTERPTPNDETLAQRVRSQILRDPALHKHRININAEHGVVVLRGEVDDPKYMRVLEKKARKVPGVRGVENKLHRVSASASAS